MAGQVSTCYLLHGSYSDYEITRTVGGFKIADKISGRDGSVFVKNIQKLNFSDISAVSLESPMAMPVADFISVDSHGQLLSSIGPQVLSAAQLLDNDQRWNSQGGLRISHVGDAVGGSVSLTSEGDVSFVPTVGFAGLPSFIYSVEDEAGNPAMSVVELSTGNAAPMRARVTLRTARTPSDPLLAKQWYLNDLNILPVWSDYTGKGVRIGQFEPGGEYATAPEVFDVRHPDLMANVDKAWLSTEQANGGPPEIVSNHATMVAGVMVGVRNEQGGVGVAYDASLGGHYLANSGEDLTNLGKMVGYDIANNSWGFKTDFALSSFQEGRFDTASALVSNARYAAHNGRGGLGTIIVAAGGNGRAHGGSAQGSLTNNNRFSIEVGAINAPVDLSTLRTALMPFSSPGASLLISAPGSQVTAPSHRLETDRGSVFNNAYSTTQGTSFAAPIVSGVVALMLQANPNLGYRDVQRILALSARTVDDPSTSWSKNRAGNWNGGGMHVSNDYGFGLIDARAAVRLAESWSSRSTGENETLSAATSNQPLGMTLAPGETRSSILVLSGGVDVEHIEVDFDADVGRLSDLTVKLIGPGGTQSILLEQTGKTVSAAAGSGDSGTSNVISGSFKYTFMSTHHWGEVSEGNWTLEVTDSSDGLPVTVNNWSVRAYGQPSSLDDMYFYTDEYAASIAERPDRARLDDGVNGKHGGRNTINAAAVSGDVAIDLASDNASIGGNPLALAKANDIHNLISGDGNDMLIAGASKALLDGGRGVNTLTGGTGQDSFVVHRRDEGCDTVNNFDAEGGEVINLVGFSAKTFSDLTIAQEGGDVRIEMGRNQRIVITRQARDALTEKNFSFQDTFVAPSGYLADEHTPSAPVTALGTVVLHGGGHGVSYTTDEQGQLVPSLSGTIYSHDLAPADVFVIAAQDGVTDYRNTLRGFKHGVDKIDLSQTGVTQFSELTINKSYRATINGVSQIHGVEVEVNGPNGSAIQLLYIDALDVSQLDKGDFIFAGAQAPLAKQPLAPVNLSGPQPWIDSLAVVPTFNMIPTLKATVPREITKIPSVDVATLLAERNDQLEKSPNERDVFAPEPKSRVADTWRASNDTPKWVAERLEQVDKICAEGRAALLEVRRRPAGTQGPIPDVAQRIAEPNDKSERMWIGRSTSSVLEAGRRPTVNRESTFDVATWIAERNDRFDKMFAKHDTAISAARAEVDISFANRISEKHVSPKTYFDESVGDKPRNVVTLTAMDGVSTTHRLGAERLVQAMAGFAPVDPVSSQSIAPKTTHQQLLLAVSS